MKLLVWSTEKPQRKEEHGIHEPVFRMDEAKSVSDWDCLRGRLCRTEVWTAKLAHQRRLDVTDSNEY